ncbi:hypothetical protein [Mycobacterium sp.]|uniref:hypothetical protein n=1 Tax=Mycobacterium sp. TaxID=1785 RepID=UPI003A8C1BB4
MPDDQPAVPDVDRLARSMLMLHGAHHDHDEAPADAEHTGTWAKSRDFTNDPQRAAAVAAASRADREHYLTAGLNPVDCRFCHVTVAVRLGGPGYTAVQWNGAASRGCAHFTEIRSAGGDTARTRTCPRLSDSIEHAVAEGILQRDVAG